MERLKTEKIESRTYQEVIAASALEKNTLVVLPTGLGKTVIASMVSAGKLEEGKILVMAPTKPLVEQHRETFTDFLDIEKDNTVILTGDIRPDQRTDHWKTKSIIFATPQIVENDLISGKIPRKDFSLAIFDEAHRATGEYSYVFISEKIKCSKLALTASPGGEKEKIMEVAENLDIENFEVRTEDDPDVKPYIEDKQVKWDKISLDDRFEEAKKHMEDAKRDQLTKLKKMGFLSSTSNVHKGDLLRLRGEISSKISTSDDPKNYQAISRVACALKISQAIEFLETQGVSQCYDYLNEMENDESKAASKALNNQNMMKAKNMVEYLKKKGVEHPKIEKVRDKLGNMGEDEKAIVFTEYRDSAEVISKELETEGLNSRIFIGQQGDRGMSQKEQKKVLEEFREGLYDVIVSTSIGEEGLDIPSVDKVIFYEPVASGIRDIQRAGRTGRQEAGEVHVLIAENTRDEGNYWSSYHKKKKMKSVLEELKQEDLDRQETLDEFENKEDSSELTIYADDRENSIAKELSRMNITVEKERMEVGDFKVADEVVLERKTASDFVDSIVDNRLFDQLNNISQFAKPILLIEGENLYSHRNIDPGAIRGALSSVALDYSIPIIWSSSEKETAELLKSLADREQSKDGSDISLRGEKIPRKTSEQQKYIVSGLPEINNKIAGRLLDEFGSIEQVFTSTDKELKQVKGIGVKTASKLRDIIEEQYEE